MLGEESFHKHIVGVCRRQKITLNVGGRSEVQLLTQIPRRRII